MKRRNVPYCMRFCSKPYIILGERKIPPGKPGFLLATAADKADCVITDQVIHSVTYHDHSGSAQQQLLKKPVVLNALSSHTLGVHGKDLGSSGMAGCYVLNWKALQEVNAPLAEMIIGHGRSGISYSFVFEGVPIKD